MNQLVEKGAEVIYSDIADTHVSGHACQEELKLMHSLIRPKFFMPVHGEFRHLKTHAELAHLLGMPEENIFLLENGDSLTVSKNSAFITLSLIHISGLPGENAADFRDSLERIWSLGADNITLHTLAVKRGSGLKELDQEYNYKNEELCTEMLDDARLFLTGKGYRPYYLYRQKHTSGNTENLGFCRADSVSIYNVRIKMCIRDRAYSQR